MRIFYNKKKWFRQSCPEDDLCSTTLTLLYHLRVSVVSGKVRDFLYFHSSYPKLNSVTDLLASMGIESLVVKLSFKELKLNSKPVIIYSPIKKAFLVVIGIDNKNIHCLSSKEGYQAIDSREFNNIWEGTTLVVRNNLTTLMQNSLKRDSLRALFCLGLCFFFLSGWMQMKHDYVSNFAIIILNLLGMLVSLKLVLQITRDEVLTGKAKLYKSFLFGKYHPNLGCNRYQSAVSLFGKKYRLDDLIVIFFLANFFILTIAPGTFDSLLIVSVQLFLLFSYFVWFMHVFYSFLYKSRQLCIHRFLSSLIVILLFILWLNVFMNFDFSYSPLFFLNYMIGFIGIGLLYYKGLRFYSKVLFLRQEQKEYSYVKEKKSVWTTILNQNKLEIPTFSHYSICFGNLNSNRVITLIMNPLDELSKNCLREALRFSQLGQNHKFEIVLCSDSVESMLFIKTVLFIRLEKGNEFALSMLLDWFSKSTPFLRKWLKENNPKKNDVKENQEVDRYIKNCNSFMEQKLTYLPSILLEGKLMPRNLSFNNLQSYFE